MLTCVVCIVHSYWQTTAGFHALDFKGSSANSPLPMLLFSLAKQVVVHKFWCERGRGTGAAVVLQRCSWGRDRRLCPAGRGFMYIHTYVGGGLRKVERVQSEVRGIRCSPVRTLARPCVHVMRLESQCPPPPATGQSRGVLGQRWVRGSQVDAG